MLKKVSILILFAFVFFLFSSVQAQNIIWVSEWRQDANEINYDQKWIDLLESQEYNVIADIEGTYESLDTAKITVLDNADLIIFGRNTNSSSYIDGGEITQWNSIDTPLILLNAFLSRSNRWQWINSSDVEEYEEEAMMNIVDSGHDIFDDITINNGQIDIIDGTVNNGDVSFITADAIGNGTVLSRRAGNNYVWIAEWESGTEFYSGTSQKPVEKRMLFSAGGSAGQESGSLNLTETGKQVFLNAVSYMLGAAEKAKLYYPPNNANEVENDAILSWVAGISTDTHNVYFGTDINNVRNASIDDSLGVIISEGQKKDVNSFDPGIMEFKTEYFWRVDEVESSGEIHEGSVWSFTTEPIALTMPFENITVTVRNRTNSTDPNNTVNGYGLDPNSPDQHSNNSGSWYTTIPDTNGAWIQYEFDKEYKLQDLLVWNYNHNILKFYGMKSVRIDYSMDGESWTEFTDVNEFNQATGSKTYTYNTIVPFDGIVAKFVRITGLENYNSSPFIGLSEVRFTYIPVRARLPYPENDINDVEVDMTLSWRKAREATSYKVTLGTDEDAVKNSTAPSYNATGNSYSPVLNLGTNYYWNVDAINNAMDPSIWTSDTWNFKTVEYISIEDFEDYNDEDGFEVWDTWPDGFGDDNDGNGSQTGHNPPPFCETEIVQNGEQSLPMYYNNFASGVGKADNSQIEREFDSIQNWTTNGADTLRLFYRGSAVTFEEASDGSIAMSGEGTDIGGATDEFRFAYKTLKNNGSITCRIDGVENTNANAEAGIMIRDTIDANSAHAMAILRPNGVVSFQRRDEQGATTDGTEVESVGSPHWVRLKRSGKIFTAEHSYDGMQWTSFEEDSNDASEVEINIGSEVLIGFVVNSHVANVLCAAAFSEISTTGNVSGSWQVAAIGDENQDDGDNTLDNLYVALEDSLGNNARVYAPANAVGNGAWIDWKIPYTDFTGVDVSRIKKIAIGVGDESNPLNGEGLIYIDNISIGHDLDETAN